LKSQSRILEAVFPGFSSAELSRKSNEELVDLIGRRMGSAPNHLSHIRQQPTSTPFNHESGFQSQNTGDDSAPLSENGDAAEDRRWNESLDQPSAVATDDINANAS